METSCPTIEIEKKSNWVDRALSEMNGKPSTRRLLFALVVVYVLGLVTGALYVQRILTPEMTDLLKVALYTTGGTIAVGRLTGASK